MFVKVSISFINSIQERERDDTKGLFENHKKNEIHKLKTMKGHTEN